MGEKNWGVKCRLREKIYDSVLDFVLLMGEQSSIVSTLSSHSKQTPKGVPVQG